MGERHPNIINIEELPWSEQGDGKRFTVRSRWLGHAAGGQRLGCSLYELPPGGRSFPFHYHLANEEAIYILEGEGMLRLGEQPLPVRAGDYIALPVGPAHAHQLINSSEAPLRYLCASTLQEPEVVVYPDSKKIGVLGGPQSIDASGQPLRQLSRHGESLGYWDGEE